MPDKQDELMALHDGELSAEEAAKLQERLQAEPDAQDFVRQLGDADRAFKQAADELLDMPVPSALVDAIRKTGVNEAPTQTAEIIAFPQRRRLVGLAIAAGLTAVVATNTQLFQRSAGPDVGVPGAAYATLLPQVMESVPSGDMRSSDDGAVSIMPVLTFRKADAAYCREFLGQEGDAEFAGVACRDGSGRWDLVTQRPIAAQADNLEYRAAEGEAVASDVAVESATRVELSYEEEQRAIRSEWQASGP